MLCHNKDFGFFLFSYEDAPKDLPFLLQKS